MDNPLITWAMLIIAALTLDLLAYHSLRAQWRESGLIVIDEFWKKVFAKPDETPGPSSPGASPLPKPVPAVEIIPVSVKELRGGVRRVEVSLDMSLNTTVEVSIGATSEAGVTVEKRER